MSSLRIAIALLLLLAGAAAAIWPLTGRQFPTQPPIIGGSEKQYSPGDFVAGTFRGSQALRGLRRIKGLAAELHIRGVEAPPLPVDVRTKATDDEWDHKIEVDPQFAESPWTLLFEVGPLPDDDRLAGADVSLRVKANVEYPAKIDDSHFEPKSEAREETIGIKVFAAGEREKLEAARTRQDEQWRQTVKNFQAQLSRRKLTGWSLAAGCLVAALGTLFIPLGRRTTAPPIGS